jgi:Cu(I)/Ag(I) efflux system protein CusF
MKTRSSIAIVCAASLMFSATTVFADSATADGEVKKIDAAAGKISIRHGPVKKFDMEDPMTMIYRVKDPSILKTVKVGDKVKFDADRENGVFTVTKIEKAK